METIAQEDYASNFFTLLKETFEGPPPQTASVYLDQGGGLLQTIESMTAEVASRSVKPGSPTIAAHCEHLRFYLMALYQYMHGPLEKIDWKQSWLKQTVNPSEWDALREELRGAYRTITDDFKAVESWDDKSIGGGMAIIAHTAYHLGSIRQLARMLA
ncbi:MAG: DinB family protein [Pyrinomonadaceae bacterium]